MHHDKGFQKRVARSTRRMRRQIGSNIRVKRLSQGMTLEVLSRRSGLPVSFIDRVEMGKGEVDLYYIMRLAVVLRMNAVELFLFESRACKIFAQTDFE